jgi:uncharacterized membrane protein
MASHPLSQTWLDRWFWLAVAIKGLDGLVETIGGIALLLIPTHSIHALIDSLAKIDIVASNDVVARGIRSFNHDLTAGSVLFVALYLLVHGLVKLGLVAALLSRRYILYPYAIVILIGFTIFQIYQLFTTFSWGIVVLTVLDVLVVWLTIMEYQRHRPTRLPSE